MQTSTQQDSISISPKLCWLLILASLIFAVLWYPLYQNNVDRQTHKEAVKALNKAAGLQAQYFEKSGAYTDNVTELGLPSSGGLNSFMSTNWQYRIKVVVSNKEFRPYYKMHTVPYGVGKGTKTEYTLDSNAEKRRLLPGSEWQNGW